MSNKFKKFETAGNSNTWFFIQSFTYDCHTITNIIIEQGWYRLHNHTISWSCCFNSGHTRAQAITVGYCSSLGGRVGLPMIQTWNAFTSGIICTPNDNDTTMLRSSWMMEIAALIARLRTITQLRTRARYYWTQNWPGMGGCGIGMGPEWNLDSNLELIPASP